MYATKAYFPKTISNYVNLWYNNYVPILIARQSRKDEKNWVKNKIRQTMTGLICKD